MGEANRRKKLDPNFGKPKKLTRSEILDFLLRRSPVSSDEWNRIYASIVPDEIGKSAFKFSVTIDASGKILPLRLRELQREQKWTDGMIEVLWNAETSRWIEQAAANLIAEFPDFSEVEDGVKKLLVVAISHTVRPKVYAFFDLIESEECEIAPTLDEFWEGKTQGELPEDWQ
jgi:hypothetical protein